MTCIYLIGLFSKYGIWIVIVKIKKCEGKETKHLLNYRNCV